MMSSLNLVFIVKKYIKVLYMMNKEIHHINSLFILFMIREKL